MGTLAIAIIVMLPGGNPAQVMRSLQTAQPPDGDAEQAQPLSAEEGLNAASAVGDDRIQKRAQGYVVPGAFTHGTAEPRVRWFTPGFKTGDVRLGDTFAASEL